MDISGTDINNKRERKKNAIQLPDGITQKMLYKYVVYYKECYNRDKQLYREFFRVEKHPKLLKSWTTSKSNKVSILEKLKQANKVVIDLDNKIEYNIS
jgi:hypothetical protein